MRGYKSILLLLFLAADAFALTPNENITNIAASVKVFGKYPAGGNGVAMTNLNASSFSSPAAFDEQATWNKLPYGNAWAATQLPWKFIYVCPVLQNGQRQGESYITNMVSILRDSGQLALLTNRYQLAIYMDVGWSAPRFAATNWPRIVREFSTMAADTNVFPNGIPYIASFLHSNGIKLTMQVYGCTNLPTPGSDMIIGGAIGDDARSFTNGVGAFPTNVFGDYVVFSTPATALRDISQMFNWGVDGFWLANSTGNDPRTFSQMEAAYGNASVMISMPLGWNNALPMPPYNEVNTNAFDFSATNGYTIRASLKAAGRVMHYGVLQSPSNDQTFTEGFRTVGFHTAVLYDNTGQITGDTSTSVEADMALRRIARDFATTKYANQGSYVLWLWACSEPSITATALSHGLLAGSFSNAVRFPNNWTNWLNAATNTEWNAINSDPAQNWPSLVNDYGTNIGGVWATKLFDDSYAVGFFNRGPHTTNMSVSWSSLGFDTNLLVAVRAVYPTNSTAIITSNNFISSFTTGVGILYRLTPLSTRQQFPAGLTNDQTGEVRLAGGPLVITNGGTFTRLTSSNATFNASESTGNVRPGGLDGFPTIAAIYMGGNSGFGYSLRSQSGAATWLNDDDQINFSINNNAIGGYVAASFFITVPSSFTSTLGVGGIATLTNGVASLSTNATLTVGTGGITNSTAIQYTIYGFTGTGVVLTNLSRPINIALGTITAPATIVLQPNDALMGTICAAAGDRGF